jgi:cytoskeletal protein CcmA (bactofilin family)
VNPYLAVAALVFLASLMLMLPLLPALLELSRKSDALPLSVVRQNAGDIRYFASSFRDYIKGLEPTMRQCLVAGATATGNLPDGEEYVVLGRADESFLLELQRRDSTHPALLASGSDLVLPPHSTFSRDIYAGGKFVGGDQNNYRAILGEKDVHLGASSRVMRWVHAVGEFTAGIGCKLYGRISSDSLIRLTARCSFMRLNAPRIEIGYAVDHGRSSDGNLTNTASEMSPRFLHDGDFAVGAGQVITSDVVIRGKLHIHAGARVCGSVKSTQDMVLEDGVSVEGSLISARRMRIGPGCTIHGPVIAERELAVATGTRCGTLGHPTTVSAPDIAVEDGVVVFGTLWARERGQAVPKP